MSIPTLATRLSLSCLFCLGALACQDDPEQPDLGSDMAGSPDLGPDADMPADLGPDMAPQAPTRIRIATFNASMWRQSNNALATELADEASAHAKTVARILQVIKPDVVLINEFDRDPMQLAVTRFIQNYLQASQGAGLEGLQFKSAWAPETNTGESSGLDLDNNGRIGGMSGTEDWAGDSFGFGRFPGQYGMLILARFPVEMDKVRTFRKFLWKDMPDHLIPTEFYDAEELEVLRLSSKNHVDLPIRIGDQTLHLLASHPTPPAFDGPEQRNQKRNHDEVRFWADYIDPMRSTYIYDDAAEQGGIAAGARFVVVGDLNADPQDGSGPKGGIKALLGSAFVQDPKPASAGGPAAAARDGRANTTHKSDPAQDTADFSDGQVGNLRADYALPSANLKVLDAGVFWPDVGEPYAQDVTISDHHLVWVDVEWP